MGQHYIPGKLGSRKSLYVSLYVSIDLLAILKTNVDRTIFHYN